MTDWRNEQRALATLPISGRATTKVDVTTRRAGSPAADFSSTANSDAFDFDLPRKKFIFAKSANYVRGSATAFPNRFRIDTTFTVDSGVKAAVSCGMA